MTVLTGHAKVDAIAAINFEGDITPKSWFKHICYQTKKGEQKADRLAIDILSDIVYWYRPYQKRDELTGEVIGWRKKFAENLLRRSPDAFAETLNATVRCIRESMRVLEGLGLITIILQPVRTPYGVIPNVMHIDINPDAIASISYRVNQQDPETIEKSFLTKWVTRNDEMGNKERRNQEQPATISFTLPDETVQSSIYRDYSEISTETTLTPNPASGEKKEGKKNGRREEGTSPRQLGNNSRKLGTNPRALGTNPRLTEEKLPTPNSTSLATLTKPIELVEETTVICEDKFSAPTVATEKKVSESTRWRQERRREVHPNLMYCEGETPWLNPDGQFKAEFVRWIATEWMKKWTYSSVYSAEEAVISNFFNEPDKIPVRWRTYSLTFNHHFERAAQRIASGGTVQEEEQQYLEANLEAVRSPMPETVVSESKTQLGRDTAATPILLSSSVPALPENFEGDPSTYQEWKPKEAFTEEERLANAKRLTEMVAAAFGKKKLPPAEKVKPTIFPQNPTVAQLQELLQDEAIRKDVLFQRQLRQWLGGREDVVGDYDDCGQIYMIERF